MGELNLYLGSDVTKILSKNAIEKSREFIKQSKATKLELADKNKIELETYKLGVIELVETLDEVSADNELKEKQIKAYKEYLGDKDDDFLKKQNIVVTRTENHSHGRKALHDHLLKKYGDQIPKITGQTKQQTTQQLK